MGGKKTNAAASMTKEQCRARLDEIASLSIGALGDDEALAIIKERKELEKLLVELEHAEEAAAQAARLENEASDLKASIDELNHSIAPDKSDEELLALIGRRKELEGRLKAIEAERSSGVSVSAQAATPVVEEQSVPAVESAPEVVVIEQPVEEAPKKKPVPAPAPEPAPAPAVESAPERQASENFGSEGIRVNPLEVTGEFKQYLDGIQSHLDSLGAYLQHLPAAAKANKNFMLKAAETDPAYVMHYADPALKSDEDFCARVAAMPNKRNSGNALAEMDPAGRTGKTVMAGVKQDYRNIRFALPDMEGYREMLEIAKRGALHKIQELKDGADVMLLVPKVLQKDAAFMKEIEKIVAVE
jgi:hypothetical protein